MNRLTVISLLFFSVMVLLTTTSSSLALNVDNSQKINENLRSSVPNWALSSDNKVKVMINCNSAESCNETISHFGGEIYWQYADHIFLVTIHISSINTLASNKNIKFVSRALIRILNS